MGVRRLEIQIAGMHCQACVASVRDNVAACEGVSGVDVSIGAAVVSFDDSKCRTHDVLDAVRSAGKFEILGFQSAVE